MQAKEHTLLQQTHTHTTREQANANDNLPDKNGSLEIYRKTKQYRRKNQGERSGCSIMYLLYHLTLSICPQSGGGPGMSLFC